MSEGIPIIKTTVFALILFCSLPLQPSPAAAQNISETEAKLRAIADAVLKESTFQFVDQGTKRRFNSTEDARIDARLKPESACNDWRYWNGVLNIAMIKLGRTLLESSYTNFAAKNIAFNFDNFKYFEARYKGEGKWDYPFGQRFIMEELDDCGAMGASVIEVYRNNSQARYRAYIDQTANHMTTRQARLTDGTFVRPFPHKWTLWADDLYMSISFLARMGEFSRQQSYFNDAARQVINFHKYLFDENSGLMHHCWYADVDRRGVAFWGRANGWALVAQIDLLDRLPSDHPKRDTLLSLLRRHILGVARFQSSRGLWHQLLDKVDSYEETSCSAMFTYTIARAVNNRYIEARYAAIAQRGWEGVMTKIRPDGQVEGVCTGSVVSDDLVYYYQRPTPLNDVHGLGTVLLAGTEMIHLMK